MAILDQQSGGAPGVDAAMLDLDEGRYYPLAEAGRRLGQLLGGRPVAPCTLYRWIDSGVSGVALNAIRVGGRWVVSDAAIRRFLAELTQVKRGIAIGAAQTNSAKQLHAEQVDRELDALGI
jgi:hypothetical protein